MISEICSFLPQLTEGGIDLGLSWNLYLWVSVVQGTPSNHKLEYYIIPSRGSAVGALGHRREEAGYFSPPNLKFPKTMTTVYGLLTANSSHEFQRIYFLEWFRFALRQHSSPGSKRAGIMCDPSRIYYRTDYSGGPEHIPKPHPISLSLLPYSLWSCSSLK